MAKTSWRSKVAGVITAGAVVASLLPTMALGASDLKLDGSISVTGLESGDTAQYYQIVQQNSSTKKWELTSAVDSNNDRKIDGSNYTIDDLVVKAPSDTDYEKITADIANAIAAALTTNNASGTAMTTSGTTVTAEGVDAGLYMVVAVPSSTTKDIVYKPVFVSADYYSSAADKDETDTIALETDKTDYKSNPKVFKKQKLEINKTSGTADDVQRDVSVGDTVTFTITTNMPSYTENFTDPVFKIKDELTTGLELDQTSIRVAVEDYTSLTEDTDFKITGLSSTGFTVEFLNEKTDGEKDGILYTVIGNPKVTITYSATVTSTAAAQVNEMDNTATLNFSNAPTDESGNGELKDKTRHYTFDIDGSVFGGSGGNTKEIEKVAIAADGTVIEKVKTTEYPGDGTKYNPLAEAEFKLTQTHVYQTTKEGDGSMVAVDPKATVKFKNSVKSTASDATEVLKSETDGSIIMKGLDAGTYTLVETKAPTGYSFDPAKVYTIKITPTYVADAEGNQVLSKYEVDINDNKSTYTAGTGDDGKPIEFTNNAATITADTNNTTTLITNQKLGLLPSTGGSGIIFYLVVGGAVAGTAYYLLNKDKKETEASIAE